MVLQRIHVIKKIQNWKRLLCKFSTFLWNIFNILNGKLFKLYVWMLEKTILMIVKNRLKLCRHLWKRLMLSVALALWGVVCSMNGSLRLELNVNPVSKPQILNWTRKYPLWGYILGLLMHSTAWDWHWGGDETLKWVLIYAARLHLA